MEAKPSQSDDEMRDGQQKLEDGLRRMWAAARRAGEEITRLREENRGLMARLEESEREMERVRADLQKKEDLIKKALQQPRPVVSEPPLFSNGEREALVRRVRDLLARIEGYL